MLTTIAFRVDGSPTIGMGHVMRCIAIAQACKADGLGVVFVMRDFPGRALQTVRDHGFDVVPLDAGAGLDRDANATTEVARSRHASAIVVDLGHVDMLADEEGFASLLQRLNRSSCAVAVIEGMDEECISMRRALPVAAIVVPYLDAERRCYLTKPGVKVFAGARYFPFRAEFQGRNAAGRTIEPRVRRVLVSIGGGDVARHNEKVAAALSRLGRNVLEVRMTGELPDLAAFPGCKIVAGGNMAELIAWADLAVIGSGLIRYETALLGTPALVFSIRPSHAPMVEAFVAGGAVCHGGVIDEVSVEAIAGLIEGLMDDRSRRGQMSALGQSVTDGKGAAALATGIRSLAAVGVEP